MEKTSSKMERKLDELHSGQIYTIAAPVESEITIQRSRFIASLRVVKNREQFNNEMHAITQLYPKASHYCWAYRFNDNIILEHSSDAGEPAGTAGRPILGALKKYSLLNIMSVVTRYYGGVKLGVKGLITAYSEVTIQAIENSIIIIDEPKSLFSFTLPYDIYNILLARLENNSISRDSIAVEFSENISGEIVVPHSKIEVVKNEFEKLSAGRPDFNFTVTEITD